MKKISTILTFSLLIFMAIFAISCQSSKYKPMKEPQIMEGMMKCTQSKFMPEKFAKPYLYAFYDKDGRFVAYIDFSEMVMSNVEQYIDRYVVLRGVLTGTEDGNVVRAYMIKLSTY